jgi:hypothetical protein
MQMKLLVRIAADGTVLSVPASLSAVTTYVLLEQERWFEKEVEFVRQYMKPGMTAIDIGANLGVYSVPMARRVGPTGAVYSFEPASTTRAHLSRSVELNRCANLHLIPAGRELSGAIRLGCKQVELERVDRRPGVRSVVGLPRWNPLDKQPGGRELSGAIRLGCKQVELERVDRLG